MKILIAEDEAIILSALQFRLKKEGHQVFVASDGKEAMQQITQHMPDVLITDIMMPHNSGIEVLAFAKNKNKNTRVIVLSAMGQENIVVEAFQLGADDYITKPFSPNELVARIRRLALSPSTVQQDEPEQ
jgi:DNA-binding response OmpR family regulator